MTFEASSGMSKSVDKPRIREVINYDGLMRAKEEYAQRFLQEKNYSIDKVAYEM